MLHGTRYIIAAFLYFENEDQSSTRLTDFLFDEKTSVSRKKARDGSEPFITTKKANFNFGFDL